MRWRLHNKAGMVFLVNSVNGLIRNTKRVPQLQLVCNKLNIEFIPPKELHVDSGWYGGFFDADGTVTSSIKGKYPQLQLRIGVTNKEERDVIYYKERFGGNIYYDRSQNGYYVWSTSDRIIINHFLDYAKKGNVKSIKGSRLLLVPRLYELRDVNAFKAPVDSALYKDWLLFKAKWDAAKA